MQVSFDSTLDLIPPTSIIIIRRRVPKDKLLDDSVQWDMDRSPRLVSEQIVPYSGTVVVCWHVLLLLLLGGAASGCLRLPIVVILQCSSLALLPLLLVFLLVSLLAATAFIMGYLAFAML